MGVEKVFSFVDWDRNHPVDRIPGDRLEAQFDNHSNAIKELERRISRLLRADGKLNHDLLTRDSFPQDLHADLAHRVLAAARTQHEAAEQALASIQAIREELLYNLAEARTFAHQASRDFARQIALIESVLTVQESLNKKVVPLAEAAEIALRTADNSQNDALLAAATAQDWAQVSTDWAEHMPDTIPPNTLAIAAVSGDHWSSRWWANQAASAVGGMLYHYYLGPASLPPLTLPNGQPVQPGAIYFNTADNIMYVYNGSAWVPFNTPMPAATASLFYQATANQTVFPLTTPDVFGKTNTLNPAKQQGIEVFLNGVRLVPSGVFAGDYTVNISTSTITVLTPVALNAMLAVDVLKDPSELAPAGLITVQKLKKFPFDGVTAVFPILDALTSTAPVAAADPVQLKIVVDGVDQEPGVDYNLASGGTAVQFSPAPPADARNFAVYFHG